MYSNLYVKQEWKNDGETGAIPINSTNLNHIEDGIRDISEYVIKTNSAVQAVADLTGDISLPSDEITKIPMNAYSVIGGANPLNINDDGGIECLKDGIVLVSGGAYFKSHGGTYGCYIFKNEEEIASQINSSANAWRALTAGTTLVQVTTGDILYLKARSMGGNGVVDCNNVNTRLNAVYIK